MGAAPNYIDIIEVTELKKEAVKLRLETAQRYFDITLLLLALVWGLVILGREKVEVTTADKPEIWMFVVANVLLVLSMATYLMYRTRVEALYWDTPKEKFPDFFGLHAGSLYSAQQLFLLGSAVVGALLVTSSSVLRRR